MPQTNMMLLARLAKDRMRVLCGNCGREVLGQRIPRAIWTGDDGCNYRSPYYALALMKGYHLYAGTFRLTPRAKDRLAQGRRPTYRRGAAGPVDGGKMVTGSLLAIRVPDRPNPVKVECPRCGFINLLTVEGLQLDDWEDRGDGRTVALPGIPQRA